jgi:hypothetical protein
MRLWGKTRIWVNSLPEVWAITRMVGTATKSDSSKAGGNMENNADTQVKEQTRQNENTIVPDWTESEWFQVWLKLARHEYQPKVG